jgi:hypothetical protein
MGGLREMMRKRPRLTALCFGLTCALILTIIGGIAAEIYLRSREKSERITQEVTIEDAPSASPVLTKQDPPPQIKPTGLTPTHVNVPEPERVSPPPTKDPVVETKAIKPAEPPKIVIPEPVVSNDVGNITPEARKIYINDKDFGYRHAPNTRGTETKKKGDKIVYKATYTTDSFGRRVTPHTDGTLPERAVLFIGCSYTFGLCVNDDQAMPWRFALNRPDLAAYNLGVAGYGSQHMLELFKTDVERTIPQKKAVVVYSFLAREHMMRAVGVPSLVKWFAGPFPWYEIDEATGRPVRKGTFKDRGATASDSGSKLLDAIRDYRSEKLTKEDAKLTALLIDEARVQFEKKFQSDGFYVIIYPGRQNAFTDDVIAILKQGGAKILDYRNIAGKDSDRMFIADDGHPTAELHQKIADKLAQDLSKADEK